MSSKIVKEEQRAQSLLRLQREDRLHRMIEVLEKIEDKIHLLPVQLELSNERRKNIHTNMDLLWSSKGNQTLNFSSIDSK